MFKSFHPPLENSGLKKEEEERETVKALVSMEDWFTCYKAAMRSSEGKLMQWAGKVFVTHHKNTGHM